MNEITSNCNDPAFDYIIFFVNDVHVTGSPNAIAIMNYSNRFGFIAEPRAQFPLQVTAHELGHGAFGYLHTSSNPPYNYRYHDPKNLMWPFTEQSAENLRKDQWDVAHPIP